MSAVLHHNWYHYTMALNIKDAETEELADEVARMSGVSKTAAVRQLLRAERDRLTRGDTAEERYRRLHRFLEEEIWSQIPSDILGKSLSKEEEEDLLGIGPDGV